MKPFNAYSIAFGLLASMLIAGSANSAETKKIGITTIVEVPQILEAKQGLLDVLAERGFKEGANLNVEYHSANGSMPTQLQIAKRFAGANLNAVVGMTTPTAQAVAGAVKDAPVVFVTVMDPVKAKLIAGFTPTGTNITGVSDAPPLAAQLKLIRELLPNLKRLGFVYNPGLDSSNAVLEWMREEGGKLGIEMVESSAPTTNEIIPATRRLVGKVDAVYIPGDTTVLAALEAVVKVGEETKLPIFTHETRGVERGALASVGLNYRELGRIAGVMVADILAGKKAGDISPVLAHQKLPKLSLVVNKKAAAAMGVTIPQSVLGRADKVIE
ncbi:MAG: ABC transporter substrate-binding protein [Pseudorhodoplanes sp.]|uniref:ABC transporter substrate-binding protein n=1 Tax=Pseudorhodoplanes sp. TaxID=1934341 RepID=UPI003D12F2C2